MAARGLLSRLSARDPSRPINEVESILENLRAILNTRVGESLSAAGFGIIDLADLVHNFPNAGFIMEKSIRATISEYEPRLRNVRVRLVPSEDVLVLAFEISARLAHDRSQASVRVRTEVTPTGHVTVQ